MVMEALGMIAGPGIAHSMLFGLALVLAWVAVTVKGPRRP